MSELLQSFDNLAALKIEAEARLARVTDDNADWFAEVAACLTNSHEITTREVEPEMVVEVLMLCMQYYFYVSRNIKHALDISQCALTLAEDHNLLHHERRLCNMMGILTRDAGLESKALMYFVQSISIAHHMGDAAGETKGLANLAGLMNRLGLFEDTIKYGRRLLAMVAGETSPEIIVARHQAYQIIARACSALGRHQEAMTAIRSARDAYASPRSTYESIQRVRVLHTHMVCALNLEKIDEAQAALSQMEVEANSSRNKTVESLLHINLAKAMLFAAREDFSAAQTAIREAASLNKFLYLADLVTAQFFILDKMKSMQETDNLRREMYAVLRSLRLENINDQLSKLETTYGQHTRKFYADNRQYFEDLALRAALRDDPSGKHSFRVGRLVGLLAERLGKDAKYVVEIEVAARLYDIGKTFTPDHILLKPGKLTREEQEIMKGHVTGGYRILKQGSDPLMERAAVIARLHHEWWDGSGYPDGLKGDEIPVEAQYTALASVFDALRHSRPYKTGLSLQAALNEIAALSTTTKGSGAQQFDPALSHEFIEMIHELIAIHTEENLDAFLGSAAENTDFSYARRAADHELQLINIRQYRASRGLAPLAAEELDSV